MKRILSYTIICFATLFCVCCETEYSSADSPTSLSFATDTLSFDTIFTGSATTTTYLALYNRSDNDILIDRIWLNGGDDSPFNININGTNATSVESIRLQGRDSLWIFVNVYPNETTDDTPFVVEDVVSVSSGSCVVTSRLLAYAQNVVRVNSESVGGQKWDSQRPYLLSGVNVVDSTQILTISEGTQIYFEEDATLQVYGTLVAIGSQDKKIVFRGKRTDDFYDDIPGQWKSLTFMPGSSDNYISYAEIAGAEYAVEVDSASTLELENVVVRDASYGAILAYGANISIVNSLLYNCGGPLLAAYGGKTSVIHCTMSNYYSWEIRRKPTLFITKGERYPDYQGLLIANSIIVGNMTDEVDIDSLPDDETLISHSYIKMSQKRYKAEDVRFEAVRVGGTPYFVNRDKYDFHLMEKSEAINAAYPSYSEMYPYDYEGKSRLSDLCPDMGAIETLLQENIK